MNCQNYQESYLKIKKAKEANILLINAILQSIDTFSGNIDQFVQNLLKIPNDLPTKRPKKIFSFKKDEDSIEVNEPSFTNTWRIISNEYIKLQPGIVELNESISKSFKSAILSALDSYSQQMNLLESEFEKNQSIFESEYSKFNKSQSEYLALCHQIENTNAKLLPENTPGSSSENLNELKGNLAEYMARYNGEEAIMKEATEMFNLIALSYTTKCEHILSDFERIDKEHEEKMRTAFSNLYQKVIEIKEVKSKAEINIKELIDPNDISKDEPIPPLEIESNNIEQLIPNSTSLGINFSEYLDYNELYAVELQQKLGIIKTENVPNIPQNSIVVITSEKPQEITVVYLPKFISAVVTINDVDIDPNLKRKLAQLKENIEAHELTDFAGKEKDIVLATPMSSSDTENQMMFCIDALGKNGLIPVDKLIFDF